MQVIERGYFVIQKWSKLHYTTKQSRERAKNAHWEYKKEEMAWGRYGCLYEEYTDHIIDSCVAYQEVGVMNNSVNECKNTEIEDLLGPVDRVNCEEFHCSPLMSRPKDEDCRSHYGPLFPSR